MQGESPTFWVASMGTEHTCSVAYGATPEEALTALVRTWVERYCASRDADAAVVAYPWLNKDSIEIARAVPGEGYVNCNHDRFWYPESVDALSERLSGVWASLAERYEVDLTPLAKPEDLLDEALEGLTSAGMDADGAARLRRFILEKSREGNDPRMLREFASVITGDPSYLTRLR